jgi:hypothetical protein
MVQTLRRMAAQSVSTFHTACKASVGRLGIVPLSAAWKRPQPHVELCLRAVGPGGEILLLIGSEPVDANTHGGEL